MKTTETVTQLLAQRAKSKTKNKKTKGMSIIENIIKNNSKEMQRQFRRNPAYIQTYEINGITYYVVSHYTGKKIPENFLPGQALKQAYSEVMTESDTHKP